MLSKVKTVFQNYLQVAETEDSRHQEHRLRIATAALLFEVARADFEVGHEEIQAIAVAVKQQFGLSGDELQQLLAAAREEAENTTSYHEFTSLINNEYQLEDKIRIVELMWQVAYADDYLEKYEEALVRKIADLLYVPHSRFIEAKHKVLGSK